MASALLQEQPPDAIAQTSQSQGLFGVVFDILLTLLEAPLGDDWFFLQGHKQ